MTLHEAITQVLLQKNKALSPVEIAEVLNATSWYTKKDGSPIKSSQISARVKNYLHLFATSNGFISLKFKTGLTSSKDLSPHKKQPISTITTTSNLLAKMLMNKKFFKTVGICEHDIPDAPGLYCVQVKDVTSFNSKFSKVLNERKHRIVYIGIATKSLRERFLNQELRAKGHGTFFRSLGAVLGYQPEAGSLIGKSNQYNYKFSSANEEKIIDWIDEHLIINWVTASHQLNAIENELIKKYLPLLNIAGNPDALDEVRSLRNRCKAIARESV